MNYKNMKIEINESQPIDEVVMELERLGYYLSNSFNLKRTIAFVVTNRNGGITDVNKIDVGNYTKGELTTLTELKAITNDQTRPHRSVNPAAFRNCNYLCGSVD